MTLAAELTGFRLVRRASSAFPVVATCTICPVVRVSFCVSDGPLLRHDRVSRCWMKQINPRVATNITHETRFANCSRQRFCQLPTSHRGCFRVTLRSLPRFLLLCTCVAAASAKHFEPFDIRAACRTSATGASQLRRWYLHMTTRVKSPEPGQQRTPMGNHWLCRGHH